MTLGHERHLERAERGTRKTQEPPRREVGFTLVFTRLKGMASVAMVRVPDLEVSNDSSTVKSSSPTSLHWHSGLLNSLTVKA
jgi:hypothetical protein